MSSPAADDFPISLSDDEMDAVLRAAGALQYADRAAFLEMVAASLRYEPALGPGSVHRVVREAMGEFLRARPILEDGKADMASRYRRGSDWTRKPSKRRRPPGPR